jgi:signal recognition particle receptor subunit beta
MAWYDQNSLLSLAFSPYANTIVVTVLVAFLLPIIVHTVLYRAKTPSSLPSFLVLGSTGSGKTALVSYVRALASLASIWRPGRCHGTNITYP